MEKIFLSVLNMSLTASFVIVMIMLARLPLKKAPKIISYTLWAVAGFRLVFPFSFESVFSLLPFKSAPIPQDIAMQTVPRIDSGINIIDNSLSAILPAANPHASINPLQIWVFLGSYIWLFGVAVMLLYSVVSIVLLKHRFCGAILIEKNLYEADNLKTPFVIGLFPPKIYIPSRLSDEERRYIVLHEQTHIRRCDHIVKMFAYLVLCLHWFNPLAWAAFILMSADMEMSCDERVMRELGGGIKNAYSLSLVRVAAGRKILNGSPLAFGEGGMKERVKNVLNFKKSSRVIIIAAVTLVAILSVGFAANRTTDRNALILKDLDLIFTNIEISDTSSEWDTKTLDVEKTNELYQMIWNIQFVKDVEFAGQFDSLYRLNLLLSSKKVEEIDILSNNGIVYRGSIYKTSDSNIDLEYFEKLFVSADGNTHSNANKSPDDSTTSDETAEEQLTNGVEYTLANENEAVLTNFIDSGTEPGMVTEPKIADGSIIRIVDFEIGDSCSLYIEIFASTGKFDENSGAPQYMVVRNTKLSLPADILVSYIDYESNTSTNGKKLISYLSQGGSYFPEPTIAKLIVHTDESGNNITELTEVYEP